MGDRKSGLKKMGIAAFFLPIFIMLVVFAVDGIYPFGDRSFLSTDMYHQYMPFFSEFMRSVKSGRGTDYTWNVGIGSNFLALYVYYLASPFHWLGLLIPEAHYMEFLTYLVVVKIGLCGLTAYAYFFKRGETGLQEGAEKSDTWPGRTYRQGMALFFSLGYALSGFLAAYNWNIMWLDCVILLPFILMGLERLVFEQKPFLYCITLALSILTNYYISIMICIFLVFYYIYLVCMKKGWWDKFYSLGDFAVFSLLAGGMAAVLLIPEVCAILATDFGDISFPQKVESYFSVMEMLARHCVAVSVEKGLDHWPNIYCGVSAFLCVPLYVLNERIPARRRFGMMALAGFILLGFSTNLLDFIWHGLNYPDSLPGRQSFIYIFLILVMCYDGVVSLDFARKEQKERVIHVYVAVAVIMVFVEQFATHEDILPGVEWLTLLFVTIYAVLLYLGYQKQSGSTRRVLVGLAVAAMVLETCINTGVTSVSNVSRSAYLENLEDYKALYERTAETEDSLYRIEKFKRKTKNDGTLVGYPTATVFSSTMNSAVMDLYERLGMRYSKVFYDFDGATAFTSALLNVKYMFGDSSEYENSLYVPMGEENGITLYQIQDTLPFGYVAPTGYDLPDGYSGSALRLQNQMVHDLGIDERLFEICSKKSNGDDVEYRVEQDGIYYGIITAAGTQKVKTYGTTPDGMEWNNLKKGSILYLGYLKAGESVRIANNDKEDDSRKISADIYRMNRNVLMKVMDALAEDHLEQVSYDSTHLRGSIKLQKEGRLILSVPCERGWKVKLNGEVKEPELFGGTLMAFDLQPGDYVLEMEYKPFGKWQGAVVTLVSVIGFGLSWYDFEKRKKRQGIGTVQKKENMVE